MYSRLGVMKCGVETSYLRKLGVGVTQDVNRVQIMRLMQWGQISQIVQLSKVVIVNDNGRSKSLTTVHNPVPHGSNLAGMVQNGFQ